jgi:hypothetical protein
MPSLFRLQGYTTTKLHAGDLQVLYAYTVYTTTNLLSAAGITTRNKL